MLLENEFVVAADVATVWSHLLDMEGVAACMPGARIEEVVAPNVYRGSVRVKIGPMTVEYRGEATLAEVDEQGRSARIELKAREARGQGNARATIRNRLEPEGAGTRVIAETDLQITGPQAQFGKGVLEDVGGRILEEFARRLEERMAAGVAGGARDGATAAGRAGGASQDGPGGDGRVGGQAGRRAPEAPGPAGDEALDLGKFLRGSAAAKAARAGLIAAGGVACLLVLAAALRRRRRPPGLGPSARR